MRTHTHDEMVAIVRALDAELAEELEAWRCPTETLGWNADDLGVAGPCGARAATVTEKCSATYVHPVTEAAARVLAYGIDPGPPQTEVRPVAYEVSFGCENGHEHYIRTRNAKS